MSGRELVATARKAGVAGAAALVVALGVAMGDGNLTGPEVVTALGGALVVAGGTYAVPNRRPEDLPF